MIKVPPPQETDIFNLTWDQSVSTLARDLAVKLNSSHFRKLLNHEVSLRFDGDANILLSSMVLRMPKYLEYENRTKSSHSTLEGDNELISNMNFDVLKNLAKKYPQMQIAVQPNLAKWDPGSFTPSVVFVPENFNESTHEFVEGFDPQGRPIKVSTKTDPDIPYVVVSLNERTKIKNGTIVSSTTECPVAYQMANAAYNPEQPVMLLPPPDPCDGEDPGGGGGGGETSHPQ